jgi:hypothetical protein
LPAESSATALVEKAFPFPPLTTPCSSADDPNPLPLAFRRVMNVVEEPLPKLEVCGKLLDVVLPLVTAFPRESTAIPKAWSSPEPPRYVEYTKPVPVEFNLVANESRFELTLPPWKVFWYAFAVVG